MGNDDKRGGQGLQPGPVSFRGTEKENVTKKDYSHFHNILPNIFIIYCQSKIKNSIKGHGDIFSRRFRRQCPPLVYKGKVSTFLVTLENIQTNCPLTIFLISILYSR